MIMIAADDSFTDNGLYRKGLRTSDTLWTPIGLQGKQARALLIFTADTMLASTQFDAVSLYRTTDAGATWAPYQNGFGGAFSETVLAIERHPQQPLVAALNAKFPNQHGKSL